MGVKCRLLRFSPRTRFTSPSLRASHEHRRLAASADRPAHRVGTTFSPCRSARGSSTTYCIRQATTPKPERWERAHLTNGPLERVARRCHRSLPPALFARDSPQRLQSTPPSRPVGFPADPSPSVRRPRSGPIPVRSDPAAQTAGSRPLSFFSHGMNSPPRALRPAPGTSTARSTASAPTPRSPPSAPARCPRRTDADTTGSRRCSAATAASPTPSPPPSTAAGGCPPC